METINFRDFMKGNTTNKKEVKLYSNGIGLGISLKTLIDLPPIIANAYGAILIIGGVAIGLTLLERKLAKHGKHAQADMVDRFSKFLFPTIFCGSVVFFVIYAVRRLVW